MKKFRKRIALILMFLMIILVSTGTIYASNSSFSGSNNSWAYKDKSVTSSQGTYYSGNSVRYGEASGVANCLGGCDVFMGSGKSVYYETTIYSTSQSLHKHALVYRSTGDLYNIK